MLGSHTRGEEGDSDSSEEDEGENSVRERPEVDGAVAGPSREYNRETESENSDEESAKMLADILKTDKEAQELEDQERAWELVRQQERELAETEEVEAALANDYDDDEKEEEEEEEETSEEEEEEEEVSDESGKKFDFFPKF